MILTPIKNLKDFVYNYNRDIMLGKCILQPLTPGLEEFVKTDTLGAELRKKALEKLSGALSKNDCTLWTWEKTIRDEFQDLHRWISHYTIGYGVNAGLTPEEAVKEVVKKLLKEGLAPQHLEKLIHIDTQEWGEYEQKYKKKKREECEKNALATKTNVHTMKADGLPNTVIAKYLNITEAEVEKLLKG